MMDRIVSRLRLCRTRGLLGVTAAALLASACAPPEVRPAVAAASDLNFALDEIADRFAVDHDQRVDLVYGSSGTLARQIRDGAPFDLFLSADETFIDGLADVGLTKGRGTLYAIGRIVLFAPTGSPLAVEDGLDALGRLLDDGGVTRFAIANPDHAPYGRAAEAALRTHGLWSRLQPYLVLGDNVSQAAQFATTGNAVGGIIAYSLARAPAVQARGTFALISEDDHPPLRQRMALLQRAGPVAERFYTYLQEPDARAILARYGFVVPSAH
jgi:molybdate transport system substrate-binding protein